MRSVNIQTPESPEWFNPTSVKNSARAFPFARFTVTPSITTKVENERQSLIEHHPIVAPVGIARQQKEKAAVLIGRGHLDIYCLERVSLVGSPVFPDFIVAFRAFAWQIGMTLSMAAVLAQMGSPAIRADVADTSRLNNQYHRANGRHRRWVYDTQCIRRPMWPMVSD